MTYNGLTEALQPYFDELEVSPVEFEMYKEGFIGKDFLEINDTQYNIVVRVKNNVGTIIVGESDGIEFYPEKTIGQIVCKNNEWKYFM